ncbi:MAG: aminotransferase class V-fold PLP-dependent enzyme, partial [Nanoarchaeota archaeon]
IGVLYGKKELLEKLSPFLYGGSMISEVTFEDSKWNDLPWKFEAGTPNIAEAIGLASAIDYLESIEMDKIKEYEEYLTEYTLEKLKEINNIIVYGPNNIENRGSVISFNIQGIHPHDVSTILDRDGIAIRGGHLCAMPLVTSILNTDSVCRISLYFYNTTEEIDSLIRALKKAQEVFRL